MPEPILSEIDEKPFCVGSFDCFPDQLLLEKDDQSTVLEPKVMRLLCLLASNEGRVIKKEDILKLIWADRVVVEGVLKRAVSALRRNLADDKDSPEYIETIPRVGYRLIAEVSPLHSAVAKSQPKPNPRRFHPFIIVVVIITLLAGLMFWDSLSFTDLKSGVTRKIFIPTLAILSFENKSGSPSNDDLSRNLGVALRLNMQTSQKLRIIDERSIAAANFWRPGPGDAKIARYLKASHVLSASLKNRHNQLYLQATLYDDIHQKSQRLEEIVIQPSDTIYRVQKQLKQTVLKLLAQADSNDSIKPANAEAYALYLRGSFHLQSREAESLIHAISFFEQSLALDKQFAPAQASLAIARIIAAEYLPGKFNDIMRSSWQHANYALELAPDLAEAQAAVGLLLYNETNLDEAKVHLHKAIELNPNLSIAHMWLGGVYYELGQLADAYRYQNAALRLDPLQLMGHIEAADTLIAIDDTLTARYHLDLATDFNRDFAFAAYMQSLVAAIDNDIPALKALLNFDTEAYSIEADQYRTRWLASGVAAIFLDDVEFSRYAFEQADAFNTDEEIVAPWLHGGTLALYLSYLHQQGKLQARQLEVGSAYILESLEEYPNDAYLLSALAAIQLINGQSGRAIATFKTAAFNGLRGCRFYQRDLRFKPLQSNEEFKSILEQLCQISRIERESLQDIGITILRRD